MRWKCWKVLTIREWERQNQEGQEAKQGALWVAAPALSHRGTLGGNYTPELSTHTHASSLGKRWAFKSLK